jgi:hypothetical protein
MRNIILLLSILASLAGCELNSRGDTTVRTVEDGARVEKSRTRTWDDRARFECLASTTGPCIYTVYQSDCDLEAPADLAARCHVRTIAQFSLAAGERKEFKAMPTDFRWCLRHGDAGEPFCRRA